jgi:hypothetical protein
MDKNNAGDRIARRSILGATAAALSAGALGSVTALGQTREQVEKGEGNHNVAFAS